MRPLVQNTALASMARGESEALPALTTHVTTSVITKYRQYLKERFPLMQFVTLSAVIASLATIGTQVFLYGQLKDVSAIIACFAAVLLLLLRLRLVDELKDLEHDRLFYPDRPVARGLVLPTEVAQAAALVFLLEAFVASTGGIRSLGAFALVAIYSFLTLKEFFVRNWLRRHFTAYVLFHEVLVLPVCFYFYSLSGLSLNEMMQPFFYFMTAFIAGHFLILEVTRKLRPKEISTDSRDTYTSNYGIKNSCVLTGFLAIWVIVTGIITAAILGSRVPVLGYLGLALFGPLVFSLLRFIRQPNLSASKAIFRWCVALVIGTSLFFILNIGSGL